MLRREAGVYIHFLQRGDTLSRVVQRHFHLHTGGSIARKVAEVARLSYIADPDRVRVGQAVVLAVEAPPGNDNPNMSLPPPATPDNLLGLQRQFESLNPTDQQVITRNWDTLNAIAAGASDGGTALSRFADAHGIGPANDIFGGAVGGAARLAEVCKEYPLGGPTRLAAVLRPHAKRLMTTLGRARDAGVAALKQTPVRTKPSFTVRISPTLGAVRAANNQLDLVTSVLRAGKWLGRGSTVVNLVLSTSNVIEAPARGKVRAVARETGSILLGGFAASAGAFAVCSLVLGLPTAGTSPIVCGILVGSIGGYLGAKAGAKIGGAAFDATEGPAARLWRAYGNQFEGVPVYHELGMPRHRGCKAMPDWEDSWVAMLGAGCLFVHGLLLIILMPILKARFDADWNERFAFPVKGLKHRYNRTMAYAFAVVLKRAARVTFQDEDYDFRGRVGGLVYLLCLLSAIGGIAGFALLVIAFIVGQFVAIPTSWPPG